ncbi:MAG: 2-amino-4-hydroxy-6-hydroxymethyldihydropteridine diphosphokinase [Anaerolineae bacterium]
MMQAYLGLGANLGDRAAGIRQALAVLNDHDVYVNAVSALYETEPWGLTAQPRFLNAACLVETVLGPHALLDTLKGIEREMGRVVTVRYGPRPIDLDILLYDGLRIATPRLTVPHPGMTERASVLVPLSDIAATIIHPITGLTVGQHLALLGRVEGIAAYPPGLASNRNAGVTSD